MAFLKKKSNFQCYIKTLLSSGTLSRIGDKSIIEMDKPSRDAVINQHVLYKKGRHTVYGISVNSTELVWEELISH